MSVDAALSYSVEEAVAFFRTHPKALSTLAIKFVNEDLFTYDPQYPMRVQFSPLPIIPYQSH